jgi:hypothetical protein
MVVVWAVMALATVAALKLGVIMATADVHNNTVPC